MSGHYKNITGYSPTDIEKYRKGELSAREMHELEKAALEDPFLADALEGMEIHRSLYDPAAFDEDREDLRTRLSGRIDGKEEKKRIFLPRVWMRWAAAVIALIGLGTFALYSISGHSKMNVDAERMTRVENKTPAAAASQTPAESARITDSTRLAPSMPPSATAPSHSQDAGLAARTDKLAKARKTDDDKNTAVAKAEYEKLTFKLTENRAAASSLDKNKTTEDLMKSEPGITNRTDSSSAPVAYLPATKVMVDGKRFTTKYDSVEYHSGLFRTRPVATNNFANGLTGNANPVNPNSIGAGVQNFKSPASAFAGKVLDEHDHPLAGAAVYLSGHRDINTTTDRSGQFRLPLQPKDSTQKLLIQYVGYEQTAIDLSQIDPDGFNTVGNIIRLQPEHPSLNEVTITGYGAIRKETLSTLNDTRGDETDSIWTKATPTVGKWAYIHYLQTAARRQPVDSSLKGVEIISFIVNKKGVLSSFKIEQSLSPAHDASTIRLIQEGPAWQLLRGRETRASVRVIY